MEELYDNGMTIEVVKDIVNGNYGFQVKKNDTMPYCSVSHIVDNHADVKNINGSDQKRLQLGDLLLAVNDISLADKSAEDIYEIIDKNTKNNVVNLTIRPNESNENPGQLQTDSYPQLNGTSRVKVKRKIGLSKDPSLDNNIYENNTGHKDVATKNTLPIGQININELMASDDDGDENNLDSSQQPIDNVKLRVKQHSNIDKITPKQSTKQVALEDMITDKSKINKLLYTRSRRCQNDSIQVNQKHQTKITINGKEIPGSILEEDDASKNNFVRLKNWSNNSYLHDTLHTKAKCVSASDLQ